MEAGFFAPLAARDIVGSKHFMPPRGGLHVDFEAFRIILWQLALQPPKTNGWNIKMNRCKRRFLLWTSSFSASISSMGKDHITILGQKVIEAPQLDVISPWRRSNVRKSWELLNVPAKRLSTGSCERFREWCAVGESHPWTMRWHGVLQRFSLRNVGLQKVEGILMFFADHFGVF